MPGKTTIAAHVDHVHYGFTLMNRWAAGEANPFAGADWKPVWQHTTVTDDQWRSLRDNLRQQAETWRKAVATRTDWDDMALPALWPAPPTPPITWARSGRSSQPWEHTRAEMTPWIPTLIR